MRRRDPQRQRGAALLLVMTAIAILTAVTVDLAYNTRVSFQIAAHARDELRAYYLAKSAVNVSRLVLHFQNELDATSAAVGAALKTQPQAAALLGGGVNFRLWEVLPVDSVAAMALLRGGPAAEPAAPAPGGEGGGGFGSFEGSFNAKIDDEDRKINVQQLNAIGGRDIAQLTLLSQLIKDEKYSVLFEEEDANGTRVSREELMIALKDWIDEDEVGSALSPNPKRPFEQGSSDENYHYDRYEPRYKAKNARLDSLDELYLVAGVGDAFMAAFRDRLTVYPDMNATINVNTNDPQQLLVNALVMAGGQLQPAIADPEFLPKLQTALQLARPLPFMSMTPQQFATILTALGVKVEPQFTQQNAPGNAFGDKSSTFRIAATGRVGDVERRIEAVVTIDKRRAGPLAADLGRLLHWREE